MLIEARDLVKTYTMGDETVHALDGVSFSVPKGDHVAIIGPSGSGKSTLMNVLGGLDTPDSGKLVINDSDIGALNDEGLAAFRNHTIGFVFQSF
ncbi:MAG: ATP-binding cassette domain-containing protein, partial [Caulobacterales bacterium]